MVARKKKAKKKTAKKQNGNPETLADLLADQGFEGATSGSYAMPFFRILQKLSPECDKDEAAYIKGAKPGMILHTVSKEVFNEVNLVPLKYRDTYIEWIPRANGGGFVSEWDALEPITRERLGTTTRDERNANILPNGNEFKLHSNYFCAFEHPDTGWEPVMVSMSASQLKTSRIWLSTLRKMTIEVDGEVYQAKNIRSFQWTFSTEKLSNDKGTWYGWTYEKTIDTLLLPEVGDIQETVVSALDQNLLTYDRGQQQEDAEAENAL